MSQFKRLSVVMSEFKDSITQLFKDIPLEKDEVDVITSRLNTNLNYYFGNISVLEFSNNIQSDQFDGFFPELTRKCTLCKQPIDSIEYVRNIREQNKSKAV